MTPKGWKLVPEDVTLEMLAAAWDTWKSRHGGKLGPGPAFAEAVRAAIAASPSPPVEVGEDAETITTLRREVEEAREVSPALLNAIRIAINAHDGQRDKGGQPYILHPLRVMLMANTEQERIVGVLHDVVEDCEEWSLERLALHFSRDIVDAVDAVDAVTRREGEAYDDFIFRAGSNPIGREVKMNDLADNLAPERIATLSAPDRERLKAKYTAAIRSFADKAG